jgi:hypothetical protein
MPAQLVPGRGQRAGAKVRARRDIGLKSATSRNSGPQTHLAVPQHWSGCHKLPTRTAEHAWRAVGVTPGRSACRAAGRSAAGGRRRGNSRGRGQAGEHGSSGTGRRRPAVRYRDLGSADYTCCDRTAATAGRLHSGGLVRSPGEPDWEPNRLPTTAVAQPHQATPGHIMPAHVARIATSGTAQPPPAID